MKTTSSPESEAIRVRFFQAFAILKERKIGTIYEFAKKYDLDKSDLMKLRTVERKSIPGWYLAALINDYGVSADWLLLGEGEALK